MGEEGNIDVDIKEIEMPRTDMGIRRLIRKHEKEMKKAKEIASRLEANRLELSKGKLPKDLKHVKFVRDEHNKITGIHIELDEALTRARKFRGASEEGINKAIDFLLAYHNKLAKRRDFLRGHIEKKATASMKKSMKYVRKEKK
ncbi:MAG: hypothetical protein J7L23_01555 [Candidatus Diapherotrites archaeon]|nr:hypothetical protein [Candidatus Diapherotrites archaeon]